VILPSLHWDSWLPVEIVHANFLAVPSAPKNHELLGEFWVVRVLEKMKPPPPVPGPVLEHVLGIDLPYVIEDFVHAMLHFSLLFESV